MDDEPTPDALILNGFGPEPEPVGDADEWDVSLFLDEQWRLANEVAR